MGWTHSAEWTSAKDIKREIDEQLQHSGYVVLDSGATAYGRRIWFAVSHPMRGRSVLLVLANGGANGWGYKDIGEEMGPADVDCPLRLLDMTEPGHPAPYAQEWRKKVRAAAAAKKARLKYAWQRGDEVVCHGKRYTLLRPYTKSTWLGVATTDEPLHGAQVYRLPLAKLTLYTEWKAAADAHVAEVLASPYLGISAWGAWHENVPRGFVGVLATPGGNREGIGTERYVLVPQSSYDARQLGGYLLTGDETPWGGPTNNLPGASP